MSIRDILIAFTKPWLVTNHYRQWWTQEIISVWVKTSVWT